MALDLVDTHCHLDYGKFNSDREQVIERAAKAGVTHIVVPGLDVATSRAAIALAEKYAPVYAAVGIHPNDLGTLSGPPRATIETLKELAQHPKVVAIGEIGLDYYWDKTPKSVQQPWFKRQLELAADCELPVIVHNREATGDTLKQLKAWTEKGLPQAIADRPGVLHSFSGTWEEGEIAVGMGFYLGFTGPITFKKADEMRRAAANVPADRVLIETDAPFLTPHPYRGKRNEPAYVRYVAEKLAEVRGIAPVEAARMTSENAARLFGW